MKYEDYDNEDQSQQEEDYDDEQQLDEE